MAQIKIRCVAGDILPSELGFTDIHEHPFVFPVAGVSLPDRLIIDNYDKTSEEAVSFLKAGGDAIVDAQPFGAGRHPELLFKLSRETGLNIIASTGCHKRFFYPAGPWWENMTAEETAGLFISEIEEGMYAYDAVDPFKHRTTVRAGVIKIATDENGVAGHYERMFLAAASAHNETGSPILTHSDTAASGYKQALFLIDHGVAPEKIIISHMDRKIDYETITRTAALGTAFSFDTIARYKYHDDESEIDLFKHLIGEGYSGSILIGLDCTKDRYAVHGGEPGYAYLPDTFVGKMVNMGISKKLIDKITIQNPREKLAFITS
jgi:phosphotriesterase-related protein